MISKIICTKVKRKRAASLPPLVVGMMCITFLHMLPQVFQSQANPHYPLPQKSKGLSAIECIHQYPINKVSWENCKYYATAKNMHIAEYMYMCLEITENDIKANGGYNSDFYREICFPVRSNRHFLLRQFPNI